MPDRRVEYRIYRGLGLTIIVGFVALVIVVISAFQYRMHGPLPRTSGRIIATGLDRPVTVIRDRIGAPHVFADTAHDLFFASGYVQAQDRLFQLDLWRRTAEGRLAEWFGPSAAGEDRLARAIGFDRQARADLERLRDESRAAVSAFAEGVNAFVSGRQGPLPVEYKSLGGFEPWRVEDTLAIVRAADYARSGDRRLELLRAALAAERGEAITDELLPGGDDAARRMMQMFSGDTAGISRLELLEWDGQFRARLGASDDASQAWVVDGTMSASGAPILANNLNLGLTLPAPWYELQLSGAGYDVAGAVIPGTPAPFVGRNRAGAWAAGPAMSIHWMGPEPSDPIGPGLAAARATNGDEFRAAVKRITWPAQTWLWADTAGNISAITAGSTAPAEINPSSHYLIAGGQSDRIAFLLSAKSSGLTAADMARIQTDARSSRAERLLPVFMSVLSAGRSKDLWDRAWRQLSSWDGTMAADQAAPLIFAKIYSRAFRLTYEDEMSPELYDFFKDEPAAQNAFDAALIQDDSPFFDDRRTEAHEDRDAIIAHAFDLALEDLTAKCGPRMSAWAWGADHQLKLVHPLAEAPGLRATARFFKVNPIPRPVPGDAHSINQSAYAIGNDFTVTSGPGLRHVVDLGRDLELKYSYPGGQSGQPSAAHYADLVRPWLAGELSPLALDRPQIVVHAASRVVLEPPSAGNAHAPRP